VQLAGHGNFQRLIPRAKALGSNQNKNAQIQRVKLSKAKMFELKLGNLSDFKKLGRVIFGKINFRIQTLTLNIYL
jgi:hypothetical protein